MKQVLLDAAQGSDVPGLESIPDFRTPGNHAGVGTGHVQEDRVKWAVLSHVGIHVFVVYDPDAGVPQALDVLPKPVKAARLNVCGHNPGPVLCVLGQVCGLGARGCAQVENVPPRLWIQGLDHAEGCLVLHRKPALIKAGQ